MNKREGMECPQCACRHSDVIWTKPKTVNYYGQEVTRIRRRRSCVHCSYVWTTVETIEEMDVPGIPAVPEPPQPTPVPPRNPFLPSPSDATDST